MTASMARSSSNTPGPKCPICDAAVKPRGENPSFPFCNARCKTIDLGKWMSEQYRIPVEDADEDEDGAGPKLDAESGGTVRH